MATGTPAPMFTPPEIERPEQLGLPPAFLTDLALKVLYFGGAGTGAEVAARMRLPFVGVLDGLLDELRTRALVEVRRGKSSLAMSYEFALTERGRERAQELAERSGYGGPAPVPLEQYVASVRAQSVRATRVQPEALRATFADLVLPDDVLAQLGPAIRSGRSLFLFGGPGNGKTAIAERIARLLGDAVYLPWALEAAGEVIKFFDPLYHIPAESDPRRSPNADRRWVLCRRPLVSAGGELTLEPLNLTYLANGRFHEAPLQLKANCGVFLIDDFGRQQISPQMLLNRWIVPLEKDVDYLVLHSGQALTVPFDVFLVFSTNLEPEDLVDEAFLRRIRYKVHIPDPDPAQFRAIFERACGGRGVTFEPAALGRIEAFYQDRGLPLRACQPRDLVNQLVDIARFYGVQPALTDGLVDLALKSYFVRLGRPGSGTAARR